MTPYGRIMDEIAINAVLARNIDRLLQHEGITMNALNAAVKMGGGTKKTLESGNVRLDKLAKLCAGFKKVNLSPWHLLVPDLDPDNLPSLGAGNVESLFRPEDMARFLRLSQRGRGYVEGYALRALEDAEAREKQLGT